MTCKGDFLQNIFVWICKRLKKFLRRTYTPTQQKENSKTNLKFMNIYKFMVQIFKKATVLINKLRRNTSIAYILVKALKFLSFDPPRNSKTTSSPVC